MNEPLYTREDAIWIMMIVATVIGTAMAFVYAIYWLAMHCPLGIVESMACVFVLVFAVGCVVVSQRKKWTL